MLPTENDGLGCLAMAFPESFRLGVLGCPPNRAGGTVEGLLDGQYTTKLFVTVKVWRLARRTLKVMPAPIVY